MAQPEQAKTGEETNRFARLTSGILENLDFFIYAVVGACFFLGSVFALAYTFWEFGYAITDLPNQQNISSFAATAIIKLISDLLLVLIILEVMGTVILYLRMRSISLRPFLFIGIISATRGILTIGAKLTVGDVPAADFNRSMIELGVNGAVILALGITLRLLAKDFEDR